MQTNQNASEIGKESNDKGQAITNHGKAEYKYT